MHQQSIDELKASKHTVEEVKHFLGEAKVVDVFVS